MRLEDKEWQIASSFGASSFVIYQALKESNKYSNTDLEILTGMSKTTIKQAIKLLKEVKILNESGNKYANKRELNINSMENWNV